MIEDLKYHRNIFLRDLRPERWSGGLYNLVLMLQCSRIKN